MTDYKQFLGIKEVVATQNTTGDDRAISAFLTFDPHGWKAYPEGDN
jgi:hypothetical protein